MKLLLSRNHPSPFSSTNLGPFQSDIVGRLSSSLVARLQRAHALPGVHGDADGWICGALLDFNCTVSLQVLGKRVCPEGHRQGQVCWKGKRDDEATSPLKKDAF